MPIRIAINGYGRIGRNVLRALYEGERRQELEIVAINDLGDANTNAHLTRLDTVHGKFNGTVQNEVILHQEDATARAAGSLHQRWERIYLDRRGEQRGFDQHR